MLWVSLSGMELARAVRGVFFGGEDAQLGRGELDHDRLADDEFVPLEPGLNAVYGLNGAGKTRFLERLGRVLEGDGGPGEGLLLDPLTVLARSNPEWLEKGDDGEADLWRSLASRIAESMGYLWDVPRQEDYYVPEDLDSPYPHSDAIVITEDVQELLSDFLRHGYLLAARTGGSSQWMLLPFLAPGVRPKAVAAHADAMRAQMMGLAPTDFHGTRADIEMLTPHVDAWAAEWRGSPLLNSWNVRSSDHFGYREVDPREAILLHAWSKSGYSDGPLEVPILGEVLPLYLPPISSHSSITARLITEPPSSQERLAQVKVATTAHIGRLQGAMPVSAERIAERVDELSMTANRNYSGFLPNTPPLVLNLGDPLDWLRGTHPRWSFVRNEAYKERIRAPGGDVTFGVEISQGSSAQQRWACLAIQSALHPDYPFVFLDEPEAGLHRTAEGAIAENLASRSVFGDAVVVVATHSPEFLDQAEANLLHARAFEHIRPMTAGERQLPAGIGLRPSDLLAGKRVFLLVEGEHDKVVLEAALGRALDQLGIHILALRGGKNAAAIVDSQFLFDFTHATMVVLLDNMEADRIREVWADAQKLAGQGDTEGAWQVVDGGIEGRDGEQGFIREFMSRAIDKGQYRRVDVHALSEPDVIFYLAPSHFVGKNSWAKVKANYANYADECRARGRKPQSMKTWIGKTYKTDTMSASKYEVAAAELAPAPPADFAGLLDHLTQVVRGQGE